jgi:hypothetical protein
LNELDGRSPSSAIISRKALACGFLRLHTPSNRSLARGGQFFNGLLGAIRAVSTAVEQGRKALRLVDLYRFSVARHFHY